MDVTLTTVINCMTFKPVSLFFLFCLYFILKSGNLFSNLAFMYQMAAIEAIVNIYTL